MVEELLRTEKSAIFIPHPDKIIPALRRKLKEKRFLHSLGVYHTMLVLGNKLGLPLDQCAVTGLLHDCARGFSRPDIGKMLEQGPDGISEKDRGYGRIWHARLGAELARTEFGVQDKIILEAIRIHPTGKPGMSPLAKLLFVADFIEPTRDFPGVERFRKMAHEDPETVFVKVLKNKTARVIEKKRSLHPDSIRACRYYLKEGVQHAFENKG